MSTLSVLNLYTPFSIHKHLIMAEAIATVSLILTTLKTSASLIHRNPVFNFSKYKNPNFR